MITGSFSLFLLATGHKLRRYAFAIAHVCLVSVLALPYLVIAFYLPRTKLLEFEYKEPPAGDGTVVLVTGAAGYIGSHMALELLKEGARVVGIDNMSRGSQRILGVLEEFPNFEFKKLDLMDGDGLDALFQNHKEIDTVFNFASVAFPGESMKNDSLYKRDVLQNAMGLVDAMLRHNVETLIHSSSCAVYGSPKEEKVPVTENSPTTPVSPYGKYKLEAEEYIQTKVREAESDGRKFRAHLLRYFNVIGADSNGSLMESPRPAYNDYARLWTACLGVIFKQRKCVRVKEYSQVFTKSADKSSRRDYVHVEDVVKANMLLREHHSAMGKGKAEIWNVASGVAVSTIEFIETARQVTGFFIPICFDKNSNTGSTQIGNNGNPFGIRGSTEKLQRETGWRTAYKSLKEKLETAWNATRRFKKKESTSLSLLFEEEYDVCVVGAGLSGSVLAERHANQLSHSVLVIDKRDHIGGNCFDYVDKETGIRVSKYGVHFFHTKYDRVWEYVNRFSEWTRWEHRALALVDGKYVPVPVNIDTVNALFNRTITNKAEMLKWLQTVQIAPPNSTAVNSEQISLERVGEELYEKIFKPYTVKQWDKDPRNLGPSVMARIPVRSDHDDRYFTDLHQALPTNGYTRIFENILNHPSIALRLNTDFFEVRESMKCKHLYYTGPIDAYFTASGMSKLEYRSLEFERRVVKDVNFYQPSAQVNHPSMRYNFTRIIEYKHLLNQSSDDTIIFLEHSSGKGEPYYPVPNKQNQDLYAKYQSLAANNSDVSFVGRLANYKYFNMDQTVLNALTLFDASLPKISEEEVSCSLGILINGFLWDSVPLKKLLESLRGSPFAIVAVTQGEQTGLRKVGASGEQLYNLRVQHNNFDWTALVAAAEHQALLRQAGVLKKFWFYTHETASAGPNFIPKMSELCPKLNVSRPITSFPSMNMGIYSNSDILDNFDYLMTQKSQIAHPTREQLQVLKGKAVESEDNLFKTLREKGVAGDKLSVRLNRKAADVYGTGTQRITEYFPGIDFSKYKANWQVKKQWALDP